ncbi:TPA: transcriptional regulator [Escherichia coli]|nr:transcriptional regulator [Escherichia coli]
MDIEEFNSLIEISSIRSRKTILSLCDYFVMGFTRKEIYDRHNIKPSYLSVKIRYFQELHRKIHLIKKTTPVYNSKK